MNIITDTNDWFVAAKQQPADPTPDSKQAAFYFGMQLEELAEKLSLLSPVDGAWLHGLANSYKHGMNDGMMALCLQDPAKAEKLLDGDADLLWVTIGSARAQGADLDGAYGAVRAANWNKRWPDGEFHLDPASRKVVKPEGWVAPDLSTYIHPSLQG